MTGKTYVFVTLALFAALLVPGVTLNMLLGNRALGSPEVTRLASEWQQATRGVTYSPPITSNGPFKTLRFHDRAPELNAVIFGASSVMGITASMFPGRYSVYNFSESGNGLRTSIGEAEYIWTHFRDRMKLFLIAFDWSIGFVFVPGEPYEMELSREAALRSSRVHEAPLHLQLVDALSLPKVENLGSVLRDVARSSDRMHAFRQIFFEPAGDEYRCPDGSLARDFDVLYRGKCGGFYYDGSSRFSAWKRITEREVEQRVLAGSTYNSKYSIALRETGGVPNPVLLERVARLHRALEQAGGRLLVIMPPLIPGLEERLARAPHSAAALRQLKTTLAAWARKERLIVIDAGDSGGFGCAPLEFLDEHHAMRECYEKVFQRFWRDDQRGIAPGLYSAGGPGTG